MSQSALQVSTVSPLSGQNLLLSVNGALAAIASLQSSTVAPTSFSTLSTALREGELWLDQSLAAAHIVRLHNGTTFTPTYVNNAAPDAAYLASNFGVL